MGDREQVAELISSLEQATLMAQQIRTSSVEQNQLLEISSSLRIAQLRLSELLSTAVEKSSSSIDPMQLGEEENVAAVEKVEEKMKECFIRNKRVKRSLSPSSATEERICLHYDSHASKLRAFDLIYQFHG